MSSINPFLPACSKGDGQDESSEEALQFGAASMALKLGAIGTGNAESLVSQGLRLDASDRHCLHKVDRLVAEERMTSQS